MLAADTGEGVILLGIAVKRHQRITRQRLLDLGLRLGRTQLVLAGDMQHQRLLDALRLTEQVLDADAVIAHTAIRRRFVSP